MNRKSTGIILLAILLGVGTGLAVYTYIQKLKVASEENRQEVVVAVVPIKARTTIQPNMVEVRKLSRDSVAQFAATRLEDVIGKVALEAYKRDDQIRVNELTTKDKVPGLAYVIPEGKRAVTIKVDEVKGVGFSVHPGDRVDILATYRDPITGQQLTQIILQRMEVLAIDEAQMDTSRTGKGASRSVTLAATPEEAQKLTVADEQGGLRMMLRPEDDRTVVDLKGVRLRDLMRPYAAPEGSEPTNLPPPSVMIGEKEPPKIKLIRGSEAPKEISIPE